MLVKTHGLVLSYIRYKDSSIIVKIFTKDLGLKSYIVNGVRSLGSKSKMAFYQPLTLLELVVYNKETANLNRISELKLLQGYQRIPFDFKRSGIAMFVAEVLSKSIYEGYQNDAMFDFLESAMFHLDSELVNLTHFPSAFLIETSKYLGFAPQSAVEFFEELQHQAVSVHDFRLEADYFDQLLKHSFSLEISTIGQARRNILDMLMTFYSLHLDQAQEWKSIKILRQIMQE